MRAPSPSPALVVLATLLPAISSACSGPPGPKSAPERIASIPRSALPGGKGTTLSVLTGGDPQGRPVLLVHGTPGSAKAWADWLLDPPPGFFFCAVDRPGYGDTAPQAAMTDIADQAAALSPLLDRLGRDGWGSGQPLVLGHSLGGPIAVLLALDRQDRVGGLVVAAGSLDPALEEVHWVQPIARHWLVRWLVPDRLLTANEELLDLKAGLERLAPRLPGLITPTVIVHGTLDDLVPFANVAYMRRAWERHSRLALRSLDGVNHFLPWNSSGDLVAALRQALAL